MILSWFILIIIGLHLVGFGGLLTYVALRSKIKIVAEKNEVIEKENLNIEFKNKELTQANQDLQFKREKLQEQIAKTQSEYDTISARKDEIKNSLNDLEEQSKTAADKFYENARQNAQTAFEQEIANLTLNLEEDRKKAKDTYLKTMEECALDFQKEIDKRNQELIKIQDILDQEKEKVNTAVEAAKRRQEIENQQDFYRLILGAEDVAEIKHLREVLPYLRDKTPLNKVIYKVYYEKPLSDMIGRVVGTGQHTGIYKITNIDSQKCYVGQAVDIANRWRQHVKRGVGAEDWTRNKLYPAMYSLGVENFTFEIIEECDRSKLNGREDYWQDFFHAKDFGYSIK